MEEAVSGDFSDSLMVLGFMIDVSTNYKAEATSYGRYVNPQAGHDSSKLEQAQFKPLSQIVEGINTMEEMVGKSMCLHQVWSLTQFFSVSFLWKIINLPGGQINDPSSGKHFSLPFLPATPSSPSRTLEGLFELTWRPSRALDSPRALLPELQRYKDTVRCAALGA